MPDTKPTKSRRSSVVIAPEPMLDVAALVEDAAHAVVAAPRELAPDATAQITAAVAAPVADTKEVEPAPQPVPVAEPETNEVAAVAAATADQGTKSMATTFETTTEKTADRVQAMFGDVNARAKTAMEKSTKLMEEITELGKGNIEALVQSSRVAAKGAEALSQEAADYGRKNFEQVSGAFRSFASVKSPTELFQLQSEYARTSFDSAVAEASKLSESYVKLMGDVFAPISSRFQLAADKLKAASL